MVEQSEELNQEPTITVFFVLSSMLWHKQKTNGDFVFTT